MISIPLVAVSVIMNVVAVLFVLSCITLILVVLIQKGRGGGLSAAFGGGAGGLMGSKTGDFLTWVTIVLVAIFLLLAIVTARFYRPSVTEFDQPGAADANAPAATAPAGQDAALPDGESPAPVEPNTSN